MTTTTPRQRLSWLPKNSERGEDFDGGGDAIADFGSYRIIPLRPGTPHKEGVFRVVKCCDHCRTETVIAETKTAWGAGRVVTNDYWRGDAEADV
jgi:hypothetical protein